MLECWGVLLSGSGFNLQRPGARAARKCDQQRENVQLFLLESSFLLGYGGTKK